MAKINVNHVPDEKNRRKPRILVAPLDWGLGHATRCIPVIYELLKHADVWLAGEGAQEALLTNEFPELPFLHLPGYRVQYGSKRSLLIKLLLQFPRLLVTIKKENKWLKKSVKKYQFDAVISDNRFGLHHPDIPCIFITHQLLVKGSLGKWVDRLLQKQNYRFINRFSACWVPDLPGTNNLAGELSHPSLLPRVPVHYTGILSRLKKLNEPVKEKHLFISLSGPEPQRTIFENIIINEISHYNGTATIVRGLPEKSLIIPSTNDIRFYNHLSTDEYNKELAKASLVICRSGYSTVMDLVTVGKKSALVATPGQPEQEYLAIYLSEKQIACSISQQDFSLNKTLELAKAFTYNIPDISPDQLLNEVIDTFITTLQNNIYSTARG